MDNMTPQEVFNKVAQHLFDQGEPSYDNNTCLNRGPRGLKCAVGVLIPDEMLNEGNHNWEGKSVSGIAANLNLNHSYHLLMDLRQVHDENSDNILNSNWYSTDTMRFALDAVAHKHSLDNSILATLNFKDR